MNEKQVRRGASQFLFPDLDIPEGHSQFPTKALIFTSAFCNEVIGIGGKEDLCCMRKFQILESRVTTTCSSISSCIPVKAIKDADRGGVFYKRYVTYSLPGKTKPCVREKIETFCERSHFFPFYLWHFPLSLSLNNICLRHENGYNNTSLTTGQKEMKKKSRAIGLSLKQRHMQRAHLA